MKSLSEKTIATYKYCYTAFLRSGLSIEDFYLQSKQKRNNLAMLRLLYPEHTKELKFPKRNFRPKILPNKEQLKIFYNALPQEYKPIFLLLLESGLRIGELLNADIDKTNKMIIPRPHNGNTKYSWISFYITEFDEIPRTTADNLTHVFNKTSKKCGIKVNPHMLRSVFVREMSLRGMPSHYIDVFCGRTPQSVLARNYTDYSPETLKEIYLKFAPKPPDS